MRRDIVTSIIGIVVLTILLGLAYPLLITGIGQVAFPGNANGQRVYVKGQLVGSNPSLAAVDRARAVLDHLGRDVAVLDHHGVVEHRHVGHAAVAMP